MSHHLEFPVVWDITGRGREGPEGGKFFETKQQPTSKVLPNFLRVFKLLSHAGSLEEPRSGEVQTHADMANGCRHFSTSPTARRSECPTRVTFREGPEG